MKGPKLKRFKLKIRAKHIKCSTPGNPQDCAVANALAEKFKNDLPWSVLPPWVLTSPQTTKVSFFKDGDIVEITYVHSKRCTRFIKKFDKNKNKVKPQTFVFKNCD